MPDFAGKGMGIVLLMSDEAHDSILLLYCRVVGYCEEDILDGFEELKVKIRAHKDGSDDKERKAALIIGNVLWHYEFAEHMSREQRIEHIVRLVGDLKKPAQLNI
jgi:hypothetical protein